MKVEYMPGIESITGSIKDKVTGKRVVFTRCRSDKPGHGRMYFRSNNDYVRSTPLSDKEIKARQLFAERQAQARELVRAGKCKSLKEAWKIIKADNGIKS